MRTLLYLAADIVARHWDLVASEGFFWFVFCIMLAFDISAEVRSWLEQKE